MQESIPQAPFRRGADVPQLHGRMTRGVQNAAAPAFYLQAANDDVLT